MASKKIWLIAISVAFLTVSCKEETREEREFQSTKRLAEMGAYQAKFDLGMCYEKGVGVRRDEEKAIKCYKQALETIWTEAQKLPTTLEGWKQRASKSELNCKEKFLIGAYYDDNLGYGNSDLRIIAETGTPAKNTAEAIKWYKQVVKENWWEQRFDAYVRLAELCDDESARREYLHLASSRGSALAKTLLADYDLYQDRNYTFRNNRKQRVLTIEPRPTHELIRFMEGIRLLEEAAEIGGSSAAAELYWIYNNFKNEYSILRNEAKAWMYLRKDHEQSAAASICQIRFLDGRPGINLTSMVPYLKEGTGDAFLWRIEALKGSPKAYYALSVYYAYGMVFPQDTTEAIRLCKQSAALGYPLALMSMGNRYYDGNGVIRDEVEAYACWNLAGCEIKNAHDYIAEMEKKMSENARLLGQKRTRELQAEIEINKSKHILK